MCTIYFVQLNCTQFILKCQHLFLFFLLKYILVNYVLVSYVLVKYVLVSYDLDKKKNEQVKPTRNDHLSGRSGTRTQDRPVMSRML